MSNLKGLLPDAFKIIPAKSGCFGCIFLDATDDVPDCKIQHDLDLLDLSWTLDEHFKTDCHTSKIIYKLRKTIK